VDAAREFIEVGLVAVRAFGDFDQHALRQAALEVECHHLAGAALEGHTTTRRMHGGIGQHRLHFIGEERLDTGRAGQEQRQSHHIALRRLAGAIFSASRYFATVRRATWMPCSSSICDSWLSDSGLVGSSADTSCLISARTAVLDALPPASVFSEEPKKYFSSKVPNGVAMYLAVVTREIVDSCSPSSSAISRST